MSGFANVTGWSSRDIQRLGHEDDDTPTTFTKFTRTYRNKPKQPTFSYVANDVWAAACMAQRINGNYFKSGDMNTQPNRKIMDELLFDTNRITDEDREQGKKVRQYFQAYTFKILKGTKLNEFDNNAMLISNRDMITANFDIAVIASLPSGYERGMKRANVKQRIEFATGGYIGTPKDRVTLTIELLKYNYSQQYNTTYFTGITSEDQVVFFAYHSTGKLDIGETYTIEGTVKAHRDNSTQLNRVKFI